MILEVAILVCLLLIVSMYAGYGGVDTKQYEAFVSKSNEGFETESESLCPEGFVDLREERDKILRVLTGVQQETHGDPDNITKASLRVGLERLIAEINRGLEEEGRFVSSETAEAIIRASKQTFRPN
jgi:hypothetical protein